MDYIQSLSILFDGSYLFLPHLSFIKTRNGSCTTCLFYVSSSKIASFITLPFRKRMQNYCLFLNQQNFLGIIFKKMKKKAPKRLKMKWEKYVVQHKKKKNRETGRIKKGENIPIIYTCARRGWKGDENGKEEMEVVLNFKKMGIKWGCMTEGSWKCIEIVHFFKDLNMLGELFGLSDCIFY